MTGVIAAVLSASGLAVALGGIGIVARFLCFVWLHINGICSREQKASFKITKHEKTISIAVAKHLTNSRLFSKVIKDGSI